jgi:hypothetical protein
LFDESIVRDVIEPTIGDMRSEFLEAESAGGRLRAVVRGWLAFWSLVVVSPAAFRRWPGRAPADKWLSGSVWVGLGALALAAIGTDALHDQFAWAIQKLPEGTTALVAAAGGVVFLAGPAAQFSLVVPEYRRGMGANGLRGPAAVLLALLSVTTTACVCSAVLFNHFGLVGTTGTANVGTTLAAAYASAWPMLWGCIATLGAMVLVGLATVSAWHKTETDGRPALASPTAFLIVGLLFLALLAAHKLLNLHHEGMYWLRVLLDPVAGSERQSTAEAVVGLRSLGGMFAWGAVLSFVLLGSGFAIARASRHAQLTWLLRRATAVALIGGVAGAAWHLSRVVSDIDQLDALHERIKIAERDRRQPGAGRERDGIRLLVGP